jgi:mono/diheme cytochrome c family protein
MSQWTNFAGLALCAALLTGCGSISSSAPAVIPVMVTKGSSAKRLEQGRALFVSRCIDCHSLPPVTKYSPERWPGLVARMSGRAHLQPEQREAIVAYVVAAAQLQTRSHD